MLVTFGTSRGRSVRSLPRAQGPMRRVRSIATFLSRCLTGSSIRLSDFQCLVSAALQKLDQTQ
jgi:hypothetical protein